MPLLARIADRMAEDVGESADQRLAVERLELVELAAVDDARDHLAHVERLRQIGADDAGDLRGVEERRRALGRLSP